MSEQSVVAPAHPSATVIETSTQPRAAINVPLTDTAGLSESQARAKQWVDTVAKPAILNRGGDGNAFLLAKNKEALEHVYHGGPEPAWLKAESGQPKDAAQIAAEARVVDESDISGLQQHFVPIVERDIEGLATRAVVVGRIPREIATEAAQWCHSAQLPHVVSEAVMDRLAKHVSEGWGPGSELTPADHEDLASECARSLGGADKAGREVALARKYLESVGGATLLEYVDRRAGSLGYDPRLILKLSMMARARGLAV